MVGFARTWPRVFIFSALLCVCSLLLPTSVLGATIGVIYPECCDAYEKALSALKAELARGGFGSAELYEQRPSADAMSWTNAFRKFVGVDADLIIIFGDNMLEVACQEKTKIPVLFGFVKDPTLSKCIKNAESPGRNITGVSGKTPLFTLLEKTLKVKNFKNLAVFDLKGDSLASATMKEIKSYGGELGYTVVPIHVNARDTLTEALNSAPVFDVLFFPNFAIGQEHRHELIKAAKKKKAAVISLRPSETAGGSIISLYPSPDEQGKLMGAMAVRLLKGDSPGNMRLESPKNIELEINLGLAKDLGLKVPMTVLKSATKVTK